jgi:hypothetical protein
MTMKLDPDLATEAKALVALAFRNGPIEDLHAGVPCAVCSGRPEVCHITDEEMKTIMKSAVDSLYRLLWQRDADPVAYQEALAFGRRHTLGWDDPSLSTPRKRRSRPK